MQKHRTLLDVIDNVSDFVGRLTSFLILFMILVTILVVIFRYLLKTAFFWEPVASYTNMLSAYVILGAAYAYRTRSHVSVDILYQRLKPKTRAIVDMATSTLFFFFFIIIMLKVSQGAVYSFPRLRFSLRLLSPPGWPIFLVWPIGVFLLLLQGLARFARSLVIATTGEGEE